MNKITILNIPIEPLEERYSIQWDIWFGNYFKSFSRKKSFNLEVETIYGNSSQGKITQGSFLDVVDTNIYKNEQTNKIIEYIKNNQEKEIVLFFHDLWFPGIINIAYVIYGLGLEKSVKICGCLHAGSYDCEDFLSKKGMTVWAHYFEDSLFQIIDLVFVATGFHKNLILNKRNIDSNKIKVTGFPIFPEEFVNDFLEEKENIIVFPHRLDSEKCPEMFDELSSILQPIYPNWKFLKSKECTSSKKEYYQLLAKSKIAVSFAKQETWGIAMQEAVFHDVIPIVPDKLSYPELYSPAFVYNANSSVMNAIKLIKSVIYEYDKYRIFLRFNKNSLMVAGDNAIKLMLEQILLFCRND
jgi:glycosyltransferase involved in cell wall biosynthesis